MKFTFYFPRWLFPQNLGDSIMTTFIPGVIKTIYPSVELTVVTDKELGEIFKVNPNVDLVREPTREEKVGSHAFWRNLAFGRQALTVYPEWYPPVWKTWNAQFDYFYNHPTINIITLNYALQASLPLDLDPEIYLPVIPVENPTKLDAIGIVPDTKLAGRPTPHPGCDGVGYRFNGPNGKRSWNEFANVIREILPGVSIYEFSREPVVPGAVRVERLPLLDLAKLVKSLRVGVLSDGGMHHVFNSQKIPVYLLGAQKVNKPYFFKLANGVFDEEAHSACLGRCKETIRSINGWPDLGKTCDLSCEKVDPTRVAEQVAEIYRRNYG